MYRQHLIKIITTIVTIIREIIRKEIENQMIISEMSPQRRNDVTSVEVSMILRSAGVNLEMRNHAQMDFLLRKPLRQMISLLTLVLSQSPKVIQTNLQVRKMLHQNLPRRHLAERNILQSM